MDRRAAVCGVSHKWVVHGGAGPLKDCGARTAEEGGARTFLWRLCGKSWPLMLLRHAGKWSRRRWSMWRLGLAIWDAQISHRLSPETAQALALMFKVQRESGDWPIEDDNNPPLESNTFQLATVAARAVGNAPGWLALQRGTAIEAHVARLRRFLRAEQKPQGDYDRTDLAMGCGGDGPGLLDAKRMRELGRQWVSAHQRADGGWSVRNFATPEEWGKGNRAAKLRAEAEFVDPPSDGHMTGLAIIALRKAGVPASDPRIQRGWYGRQA